MRLLKKSFHSIQLTRSSLHPDDIPAGAMVIINHSSWWDPLVLFYLNEVWLKKDGLAMMSIEGLERFPFFRKLGAYSINSTDRREIITSLQYTLNQMDQDCNIFIFPQGEETHLESRPLQFRSGTAFLNSKRPDIPVVPVSFYHQLLHYQLPEWFIHIGEPVDLSKVTDKQEKTAVLENRMTEQLECLKDLVIHDEQNQFVSLLKGRPGIGESLEAVKRALRRSIE
ncbi:lysophospholipid acyltransferase family protein [Salisediminibacterium beveridgei]|uniref:lysophospholipid acyltransferase family protein n=1 Tax=Salisediminibacterium beveridgei TaxID=632773 RepID=UPI001E32F9A9|nr:lysophospholipid acyltransferase family protein [Salisediminibacterium beveridgei]